MRALDAILAVVWAPRCAACDDPLDAPTRGVVCAACWRRLPAIAAPVCDRCGAPVATGDTRADARCAECRRTGGPPTERRAVGVHAGTLRAIVHAFKYDGRRSLARPLAQRMREAGGDWLRGADIAVPVPLHAFRQWRRGFNQAADLAAHLGIPVVQALRRTRHTGRQVELSRAARLEALGDAFALARRGSRRAAAAAVRGRSVVLVDDVLTTGATVDACAAVLRDAGARQVRALSAALAVAARSQPPFPRPRHPAPVRRRCAPSPAGRPDAGSSPEPA
ncbi:MAG: ComF family protein [Acidobacteria bacterium]|nr:ComF family protein [Acidobacteriota bacterium]